MWDRIEDIFARATELPNKERPSFLLKACGGDEELRRRVSDLLQAHEELEVEEATEGAVPEMLNPRLASALLAEAAGELEPGDLVGRYRIVECAARGGMGVVYRAHDPRLDRAVALKLLPLWRTTDGEANRRLEEEARAASALHHPHIATVYEIGESAEGRLFIAMAWYDGGTLRERLTGEPLTWEDATAVAEQVAEGLAAAHEHGIVHRDVKPENIAFDRSGRAAILDFGLASAVGRVMTGAGTTPGTAAYMSPEQARGEVADHRADIWALGVVLYEMLAGRRPFGVVSTPSGGRMPDLQPAAPLGDLRSDIPPGLADTVDRCLTQDRERRCQSAADLLAALRTPRAAAESPARSPVRRLWPVAAVYLMVAGALILSAGEVGARYLLPEWFPASVLVLLLLGFPIVATTALLGEGAGAAGRWRGTLPLHLLSWRRTVAGGLFAFGTLSVAVGVLTMGGMPRITDARGAAGTTFDERPWVVLADFEAADGLEDLALAAREALSVDLSQSDFVNVYSRAQTAQALRQMGLPHGTPIDQTIGAEIAERLGGGAVLIGSLASAGSQVVLSGRAIEPRTGSELFAVRAAAASNRLLGAVERLSREMRRRLGEERAQIRQSRPLPDVTTPSLEALQLYAAAEAYQLNLHSARAEELAEEAIKLDPGFAMAHRLAAVAASSQKSFGGLVHHSTRAYELRGRLTERERRHVEAVYYGSALFEPEKGLSAYRLLLERYPNDVRGWINTGATLHSWMGEHEAAYGAFLHAIEIDPHSPMALAQAAYMAAIMGRWDTGDSLAVAATRAGIDGTDTRFRLSRAFATGDLPAAIALCDSLLVYRAGIGGAADDREICGSMDIAAGRLATGIERLRAAQADYLRLGRHRNAVHTAHGLALGLQMRGDVDLAAEELSGMLDLIPSAEFLEPDRFIARIALRVHAYLIDRPDVARRVAATYPPHAEPEHWFARFGESLAAAAQHVAAGDGEAALAVLDDSRTPGLMPIGWRVFDALLRGLAHEAAGRPDEASAHLRHAADPGFFVLPSMTKDRLVYPMALEALARAEAARENHDGLREARHTLARLREHADPGVRTASP